MCGIEYLDYNILLKARARETYQEIHKQTCYDKITSLINKYRQKHYYINRIALKMPSSHRGKSKSSQPMLEIEIKFGKGKADMVRVYKGDDPNELAEVCTVCE